MDFKNLTEIKIVEIEKDSIITTNECWCNRPYPKHPKGCINYGRKPFCPPHNYHFNDYKDLFHCFYLVYINFNLKEYKRLKSEDWKKRNIKITEGKLGNSRHWQNAVRKLLKVKVQKILNLNRNKTVQILTCGTGFMNAYSMESVGINVLSTLKINNISFERNPKSKVVLVCLIYSMIPLILKNNQKSML